MNKMGIGYDYDKKGMFMGRQTGSTLRNVLQPRRFWWEHPM